MGGFALLSSFACDTCGSPAIMLPDHPEPCSAIRCSGCGARLGTWGAFKERARQVIMEDVEERGVDPRRATTDFAAEL